MRILQTSELEAIQHELTDSEIYWAYNSLDCCITHEIYGVLMGLLDPVSKATYERTLELQAPYLEMMLRGVALDSDHIARTLIEMKSKIARLEAILSRLCTEGLGLPTSFNWRSPLQLKSFFYGVLGLTEMKHKDANGRMVPSVNREILEKLSINFVAEPFCNIILQLRDLGKAVGFLETPLDEDRRIRCNFNLAGTNTGRLSSSFSDFGSGTNLQNVDKELKYVFVPDPGKVFVNIDLEQADSRNVGALAWELFHESHRPDFAGAYLDACESGDLHTTVCRMAWTELQWGDDPRGWRAIADQVAYRNLTYRDMAKKLGHGSNYMGQPKTMAGHTKVPTEQIAEFQRKYFGAFPCIKLWQERTIQTLRETGSLTHLFGRRRYFFDRLDAQSTINAAIAYCPQGMTGDEINIGVQNLWAHPEYELLVQVHDSILFQIDQNRIDELVPKALELLKAKLTLKGGREFFVPVEAKVGWNWGDASPSNPLGLSKWKGSESRTPPSRKRTSQSLAMRLLK